MFSPLTMVDVAYDRIVRLRRIGSISPPINWLAGLYNVVMRHYAQTR